VIHALLAVTVTVTTIAGTPGIAGRADGVAATFNKPTQLAIDAATGNVFVADRLNNAVRKISGGRVSTLVLDKSMNQPYQDLNLGGPMSGGVLLEPPGAYGTDTNGFGRRLFIVSSGSHQIVQATPDGFLAHDDYQFVGAANVPGFTDLADHFNPAAPFFTNPTAMTLDRRTYPTAYCCAAREIFVVDTGNHTIRKMVRVADLEGMYQPISITTFAGVTRASGSADGPRTEALFKSPRGAAFGPDHSLYVADTGNHTIRRIWPTGMVTTIAGRAGEAGSEDGLLNMPTGIDVDDAGNVYFADTGNSAIRRIRPDGVLETIAGVPGAGGYADGDGSVARFNGPVGLQIAPDGSLIVADTSNQVIRKITIASPPPGPRRRGVRH
jgi:DNA-binding beta-propeller fold protein YncE